MSRPVPEMLQPTLVAGLGFGVVAGLPLVKVFNTCTCCSLTVACGVAASYLYAGRCRREGAAFRPGSGAIVGLIAGAFFGVSAAVSETLGTLLVGEPGLRWLLERFRDHPSMPDESAEMLRGVLADMEQRAFRGGDLVLGVLSSILFGALFSTIGGAIGGALFGLPALPEAESPPEPDSGA